MQKIFKKMVDEPVKAIVIAKILVDVFCVIFYHNMISYLLSYPPLSINTPFQLTVNPTYYSVYYFGIFAIGIPIDILCAYRMLKPLKHYNTNQDIDYKLKIRKICYTFSNKVFYVTTFMIPIFVTVVLVLAQTNLILSVKIGMLVMVFLGIPNLVIYLLSNRILKEVLVKTFDEQIFKLEKITQTKVWKTLLTQIFSAFAISMVIIFMFVVANLTEEIGKYRYETYKERLKNVVAEITTNNITIDSLNKYLENEMSGEEWFVKINDEYYGNIKISQFMKNYMEFYAKDNGGRIYDDFGIDRQAVVEYLNINNMEIIIGLTYNTIPDMMFTALLIITAMFLVIDYLVIFFASRSIGIDLDEISGRLADIAKNKEIELTLLPVTSIDEIGELTKEFNEVQSNTINLYEEIKSNQEVIMLQNKFVAIGELAAGMAHDINNPASSLDTSINLLKHFKVEEEKQEQYNKLVENMKLSNNKILSVVNNTQDQFRNTSKTDKQQFSLKQLLINLANSEEQDAMKVNGKVNVKIEQDVLIYGIESRLYQVILNLVRNSILSYREKNRTGNVDIEVSEDNEYHIISVKDNAGGIPEEVRNTIFKKILTTRGAKGTGLGLYLAAGIIEGDFKGKITFETEKDKGTIFYIKLPKNKEE